MIGWIKKIQFISDAGAGEGGVPISADRYVSQSAVNGYPVGSNANDGLTPEAPWLTLDHAITNSPSGSVIAINDGTYAAATTFYSVTSKSLTLRAQRRGQVTLQAQAGQSRIINFSSGVADTLTTDGINFHGQNNTQAAVTIGSGSVAVKLTVNLRNGDMSGMSQRLVFSNSQKNLDLSLFNMTASGTWAGLNLVQVLAHEAGAISINGLEVNGAMTNSSTKNVVDYRSVTGVGAVSISNLTGSVSTSSGASVFNGVSVSNIDGAVIDSCNLSLTSGAGVNGALYQIKCDSASLSANGGRIANCRGHNGLDGGYCAVYGQDASSVGNNLQNDGIISGCVLTANPEASGPIHGLMLGYGTGGEVYENQIAGAALATIAKQQVGGEFRDNTISGAVSEAIRSKGSTGTAWRFNTVNLAEGGDGVNVDANDSPATDSTDIFIEDNTFNIDATPSGVVAVATGSDAAFTGNTYNVNAALGADPWSYQGTAYQTLAAWKAAVEPTAMP